MNFDQLELFLAIEKHRHFTKAAEVCNISQSSLSKKIQSLEAELGTKLIDRNTRTIEITSYGFEFAKFCKEVLEKQYLMKATIKSIEKEKSITIGSVPVMTLLGITSLITHFQQEHPDIKIEIIQNDEDPIISLLQTAKIDLAFLRTYSAFDNNFIVYPLFSDRLVLIVAKNHPFADIEHLELADAANESFIFLSPTKMYNYCINACLSSGFSPNVVQKASRIETIFELVSEGVGVSLLMSRYLKPFSNPTIKVIQLRREWNTSISLIVHKEENLSQYAAMLKDFAIKWAQSHL